MKNNKFLKASKPISIIISIMMILSTFVALNVISTDVTNNNAPADYVKASQTYVLVMNFTISTQSDSLLGGTWPADGTILENSDQSDDWGSESGPDMWFYDATEDLGPWNASEDCIFLDDVIDNDRYNTGETLIVGTAPSSGTFGTGRGCKHPTAWIYVKSYDPSDGGAWNSGTDAIILEGSDNNTALHDELNAVTFNLSSSCNASNSDIDDLTLWLESSGLGFDSSADTLLGNATYSTNSFSWNISSLSQDINTSETFYVAVNISGSATHWNAIVMEIPTLSDSGSSGSYDDDDQGLFLAGTNDTGGVTNGNAQTIDTNAPDTSIDVIDPYWNTSGSISISSTATDNPSGIANVTLYYRYSNDNSSWGTWVADITDSSSPYSWTFSCPNGSGYYEFYSRGVDNANNNESAPANNDTISAYDDQLPDSTIIAPADAAELNSLTNITGTASDTYSGVANVSITIYNITDDTYFNGTNWQAASFSLNANGTTSWYYSDTEAFPTWVSGKNYTINSTATDNASNVEAVVDSNTFNYDTDGPTTTISVPTNSTWYNTLANITGTASDTGGSGVNNVNLTIFNQTGAKYWNGSDWQSVNKAWMNTNGSTSWFNDSNLPTWDNGSTYLVNATATDQAGNVGTTSWNDFYYDNNGLNSQAIAIDPYWQTNSPLTISYTAADYGSGLNTVALYYRFSNDNSSWGTWVAFGTDSDPWTTTTFSFTFSNGSGFYEFYTIATDNASNTESTPVANDTICGYDPEAPTGTITLPTNGGYYNSGSAIDSNITGTATDVRGVTNVNVEIFNITGNMYFNGSAWQASYTNLSANLSAGSPTKNWWYENTTAFPTWATNNSYYINISALDTAGNWNDSAASSSFLYDTDNPSTVIVLPVHQTWYNSLSNITGESSDDGGSGVATVNITIYNSTGDRYWNGSDWQSTQARWINTNGTTSWYNDSGLPTWTNGTTYIINSTATDNAGNVGSADSNTFYMDTDDLASNVDAISTYWQTSTPLAITANATDSGSGLNNVTLYYYFSSDNGTFFGPFSGGVNSTPWIDQDAVAFSFDFTTNGTGYYRYYTIATDNASNTESAPVANDTICGYDPDAPTTSVTAIDPYWNTSTEITVSASASDSVSDIASVAFYYYNSTDNATWTGPYLLGTDTSSPYTATLNFSTNGSTYYRFYSRGTDNAGNVESAPVGNDTMCGADRFAPTSSVDAIDPYWNGTGSVALTATASDNRSGLASVSFYYYNSSDNTTFTGPYLANTDTSSPYSYTFTFSSFNGTGYYRFYSTCVDNASNTDSAPATNDTMCSYDPNAPTTNVDAIDPYWDTSTEITLTATSSDSVSGVASVTFYYYNSTDNSTWTGPYSIGTDSTDPYTQTFNFSTNGSTYYRFYSRGTDNASNTEAAPVTNDTMCGADRFNPSSSVDAIVPYWNNTGTVVLTATASDNRSGLASVSFYYYNSSDNTTFTGPYLANTDTSSPYSYSFEFSSFNGTGYYRFYSTSVDNAGNSESAPATNDTICGYDTEGPTVSNVLINDTTLPSETYVKDGHNVTVTASITDLQLTSGDTAYCLANLSGLGGSATAAATAFDGSTAWWNLTSVSCTPSDGTITVTINASDPANNYNDTESDTITADNTAPSFSYAVLDADNDGTNYTYVDVYFSETINQSTVAVSDFNISINGVGVSSIQSTGTNMATVKFNTTFQTGGDPTIGIAGSIEDSIGNAFTSGTVVINTYRIPLQSGLNLISIPANASTQTISTVLQNLSASVTVWRYNANNNTWTSWVAVDGDTFRLEPGVGYWFSANQDDTLIGNFNLWPSPGYAPPASTLYAQTWNLIGHYQAFDQTASTNYGGALASLSDSDIGSVWKYTSAGGYTNILVGQQNMEPGSGYWMFLEATSNKIYTPS